MTKTLISALLFLTIVIPVPFLFFVLPRVKPYREWRLERLRKNALRYIDLLDKAMKAERYPRFKRRQFWRKFVHDGRFNNEGDKQ